MANGIIADYGATEALTAIINRSSYSAGKTKLYKNNVTPADADVVGTYTESTFTGYAAVTNGAWGTVTITAHVAQSIAATVTFTLTAGSENVYGMFMTDSGGTNLVGACRDPNAPVGLNTTINTYQVTVTLQLQSAF